MKQQGKPIKSYTPWEGCCYSGLTKQFPVIWSQILTVSRASLASFVLIILFVRWEGLQLKDVGVIPGIATLSRVVDDFIIGLILASLQALLVVLNGYIYMTLSPQLSFTSIGLNLLL